MFIAWYKFLSPYLAGFFLITSLAFSGLAIYRGEVISSLQSDLIAKKDQEIKVVIERNDIANDVSKKHEQGKTERETRNEITIKQVETIVKEPIYLNTCFDDSGLSVLNGNITSTNAREHSGTLPESELAQ
ncbi:Rz-like spanin [Acinetobacter phage Presley]|uniref:Uncharacterized protein n=1 Tax=Acinetobacter phage Presley TaxID=1406780 RepID=U5PZQ1_9CAUD|nr:Rz-like spanin [Acinetobacter phage Presley]AGY48122.1 hypothetical protein Presley_55 [Acinetobacter phage Presley]